MPKLFSDRTKPAQCPFCRREILPPREIKGGQWFDFPGGYCACGAVFALDPTARNGGAVLLQAMLMACKGDMERVLGLSLETDYEEGHVHKYNDRTHQVEPQAFGTLYFIRLREEREAGEGDN
ncbi:MAG: hypothetical protein C4567_08615 [Deltaproteobacteria bacterium]|nr:MAG: hypothetical protein C4567_08615 [Deltaproteobacteria bacterium]